MPIEHALERCPWFFHSEMLRKTQHGIASARGVGCHALYLWMPWSCCRNRKRHRAVELSLFLAENWISTQLLFNVKLCRKAFSLWCYLIISFFLQTTLFIAQAMRVASFWRPVLSCILSMYWPRLTLPNVSEPAAGPVLVATVHVDTLILDIKRTGRWKTLIQLKPEWPDNILVRISVMKKKTQNEWDEEYINCCQEQWTCDIF